VLIRGSIHLPPFAPELRSELAFQDFPRSGLGQRVDEVNRCRAFEMREPFLTEIDNRALLAGRLLCAITFATVNVLPLPVIPSSTWCFCPAVNPAINASIAAG
jgi:hypothetical protein